MVAYACIFLITPNLHRYPPRIDEALRNLDAGLIALRPLESGTVLEDDEIILSGAQKAASDETYQNGKLYFENGDTADATRNLVELDSKMEDIFKTQREVMEKEESQLLLQGQQSDEGEEVVPLCSNNRFTLLDGYSDILDS